MIDRIALIAKPDPSLGAGQADSIRDSGREQCEGDAMKLPRRISASSSGSPPRCRLCRVSLRAQAYPSRPVRIIVGFAAGGGYDIVARLMGQWLSERLGQPFVIENRPGAGTNIATQAVVNAPPDGDTLLLVGSTNAINASFYRKLNFNFIRDIAPVSSITRQPQVMLTNHIVRSQDYS